MRLQGASARAEWGQWTRSFFSLLRSSIFDRSHGFLLLSEASILFSADAVNFESLLKAAYRIGKIFNTDRRDIMDAIMHPVPNISHTARDFDMFR
jgi:hypothetical protein